MEGKLLTGIPMMIRKNAMRVMNEHHSYIIPMDNVDYIRTPDGLQWIESEFEDCWGGLRSGAVEY